MPNKQIKLADDLVLPMRAVTEMFAFLGRRGSGKTYGASKMAEEMLFNGAQVVVIDPMGVWYGLRLDADGKKPSGIDIPVFGGLRSDLPLTPESGALVADILVDRRISAILDVSQMIDAEVNRFCTAFGTRFFQRMKAKPAPVHLILEECQELLPQNVMKGEEKKLHVYQRIAKQGRSFGIGLSMISQRPQEINKKALNMIEVMFAFQMTGPHERKAIEAWVADKGEDLDIVNELPKFKIGKPHVWSPQWLGISKQISILQKRTFDASATPEFGSREAARELTPVDVVAIKEAMQEMIQQAQADDPSALKREIARLKKELASAQSSRPAPVKEIERVEVPIITDAQIKALAEHLTDVHGITEELSEWRGEIVRLLDGKIETLQGTAFNLSAAITEARKPSKLVPALAAARDVQRPAAQPVRKLVHAPALELAEGITGPQQRILDAMAWMESIGLFNPKRTIIAFLAGYSATSTGFTIPLGLLRKSGLITYPDSQTAGLTDPGRAAANPQPAPLTTDELHRAIFAKLTGPQGRILKHLIQSYPHPMNRDELAERAGYSPISTGFTIPLGNLRTMGLIDYPSSTEAVALPILFLE
jgi:uncharacterized protein DUF87